MTLPSLHGMLPAVYADVTIEAIFSDPAYLRRLVEVERALAQAEAAAGIIPELAAVQIAAVLEHFEPDYAALHQGVEDSGVPVIELLRQLRSQLGADSAPWLHWGATSQDIMDTALALQLREALDLCEELLRRLIRLLAGLAQAHRLTLMAGRTHSQQAVPITFGFKVAGWLAPLIRDQQRLTELRPRLLVLQFGGAAGTLAPLGDQGERVEADLAARLKLGLPLLPWHTQRDSLAELAGWLSLLTGSLGKLAQDLILMAQSEVAEVKESGDTAHGGSSTMPHKRNPIHSELIVAGARLNAALLSALHQGLMQEHERATHGWQIEWQVLPQMLSITASSLRRASGVIGSLQVDSNRMQANIEANLGLIYAESFTFALAQFMDRAAAERLVRESAASKRSLIEVLREQVPDLPVDWEAIQIAAATRGSAQRFIDRVLRAAQALEPG